MIVDQLPEHTRRIAERIAAQHSMDPSDWYCYVEDGGWSSMEPGFVGDMENSTGCVISSLAEGRGRWHSTNYVGSVIEPLLDCLLEQSGLDRAQRLRGWLFCESGGECSWQRMELRHPEVRVWGDGLVAGGGGDPVRVVVYVRDSALSVDCVQGGIVMESPVEWVVEGVVDAYGVHGLEGSVVGAVRNVDRQGDGVGDGVLRIVDASDVECGWECLNVSDAG